MAWSGDGLCWSSSSDSTSTTVLLLAVPAAATDLISSTAPLSPSSLSSSDDTRARRRLVLPGGFWREAAVTGATMPGDCVAGGDGTSGEATSLPLAPSSSSDTTTDRRCAWARRVAFSTLSDWQRCCRLSRSAVTARRRLSSASASAFATRAIRNLKVRSPALTPLSLAESKAHQVHPHPLTSTRVRASE
eukprot:scaffold29910_cov53-Phaeocystis_antarctica.AAC.1